MDFKVFTEQALRTESKVTSAPLNVESFKALLKMFITVGTLLDYTKKGIFYNNYAKLDENYRELMTKLNDSTAEYINSDLAAARAPVSDINFRVLHGLLGAMTESSEIAEHLLNYLETGVVDRAGIAEEFSDSDWYKAITFDELALDEVVSRQNVVDKLRVRFPTAYSDADAAERNLEKERSELEKNV